MLPVEPIFLNGGTLQYTGTTTPTLTRTINIGAAGGTLNLVNDAGTGKLVINGIDLLTGSGNISKTGPGWLTLYGTNNTTGNWNIANGVVEAGGAGVLGTGSITLNSGGELSNNNPAIISNPITINSGTLCCGFHHRQRRAPSTDPITANGNFNVRLGNFWSNA